MIKIQEVFPPLMAGITQQIRTLQNQLLAY